jgi:hypothetical protein
MRLLVVVLLVGLVGCTAARQYTSLDLALLPCEQGDSPIFFQALEFDERGTPLYEEQGEVLHERLRKGPAVTDLVFFVHGWNKNVSSAESDYQNFFVACTLSFA